MLNVACFVQSRLTDADFVIFSNYCLIGTRRKRVAFFMSLNPKESNGRNIKCDLWKHFPPRRDSEPHVPTHMQNAVFCSHYSDCSSE